MCESYVHAYSNPCCSARCISSIIRWYGGSGRTVTPKLSIEPPRSLAGETSITPLRLGAEPAGQTPGPRSGVGDAGDRLGSQAIQRLDGGLARLLRGCLESR